MSDNISDLRDLVKPKSDQLNADDLLISGAITVKITEIKRTGSTEQPLSIYFEGCEGRPFKPCTTMRRAMMFGWGTDGNLWVGRSITLFNDTTVMNRGERTGGVRISHMSHLVKDIAPMLTATKGKKAVHTIKRLDVAAEPVAAAVVDTDAAYKMLGIAAESGMDALKSAWGSIDAATKKEIGKCPDNLKTIADAVDNPPPQDENEELI